MSEQNNDQYRFTSGEYPGQFRPSPEEESVSLSNTQNLTSGRAQRRTDQTWEQQHGGSGYSDTGYSDGGRSYRKKKPREKKFVQFTRGGITALILVCVLASGAFGYGGALLANHTSDQTAVQQDHSSSSAPKTAGFNLEDATGSSMTVQEITKKTQNSVVEIRTETVANDQWMQQYITEGAGSGVIIRENGYILTNNHVISNSGKIYVSTKDGKEYQAKLIGTDPDNDLAVLKIKASGLQAATFGNSDQLNIGDLAVAIGNPLGQLGGTVTAGIISARDRSISLDGKTMNLLQTDTSINPGNSGGGLFNQYGQLVGIVVAKSSGSDVEGLGFAIPINKAANVAEQLISTGHVKGKVSTGMTYVDNSSQSSSSLFGGFMQNDTGQVYIYQVNGRNAKKAGFKAGDMVYSVDGQEIDSFETLSSIITSHKVGDKVKYVVVRDYEKISLTLTLGEKSAAEEKAAMQ